MLIYLHGLNSSAKSYKVGVLRERLAPVPVLAPNYPAHRPALAVAVLSRWFWQQGLADARVIGSSMGGFYAQWLGARVARVRHVYMINPALQPWALFPTYLGTTQTTARGEHWIVARDLIDASRRFGLGPDAAVAETTLFLDRGDEIIDFRAAEALYRGRARLRVFEGGDHAFQHMDELVATLQADLLDKPRSPDPSIAS